MKQHQQVQGGARREICHALSSECEAHRHRSANRIIPHCPASQPLLSFNVQVKGGAPWCRKVELSCADLETPRRLLMELMYYIGLDVHKQKISYCILLHGGG